jgi:hypothetical protein
MNSQDLHNLQEAYLEVYDEAYKRFPYKKVEDKIHKKEANNPTGRGTPQSVNMGKAIRHFRGEVRRTERREHSPKISKAKEAENRERGTQKEQVDLYDIILSHLLDEGYADTQEQAEVIMVNMSEDWRESICEGFKKYPAKKVADKIDRMYNDPNTDIVFGDSARRRNEMMRVMKHMKGEVHPLIRSESPKKSKAKEKENRTRGVSDN